jgi:hypothetical protein
MSKSLLNFLVQISKALVNSKIQFLIQKSFLFTFGPATLTGTLSLRPSRPRWPLSSRRTKPTLPAQAARPTGAVGVFAKKYIFFCDSRLPFSAPSLYPPADTWAPLVGFVFSTAPLLPTPPALRLECRRAITAPITPPLIPFKPSLNKP